MDGVFLRKKWELVESIIGMVCGIALVAMMLLVAFKDPEGFADAGDRFVWFFMVSFGGIICVGVTLSLLYNRGAYLHLTQEGLSAKFAWRQRLDCAYSEIAYVECGHDALSVKLKSGKRYTISGLANGYSLCDALRKKIHFGSEAMETKADLLSEIRELEEALKRMGVWLAVLFAVLVGNVFLFSPVTGQKRFSDFARADWAQFVVFLVLEICIIVVFVWIVRKACKKLMLLSEKRTCAMKLILQTTPPLPGNSLGMYVDSNYRTRVTVFGYPDSDDVYYCVESLDRTYELTCTFRSPVYSDSAEIERITGDLIKIME